MAGIKRYGARNDRGHRDWLVALAAEATHDPRPLHPVIADFAAFIADDARIAMLFALMFEQAATRAPYGREPAGERAVRDVPTLLRMLNLILHRAPEYNRTAVVGVPINAILDRVMATVAGFAAFQDPQVNAHLRAILDEWARYLGSPASRAVLSDDRETGWFGAHARADMPDFDTTFVCDPAAPYYGFASWDDFFTRRLRPGARPVAAPDDSRVLVNACEAAPYRVATEVKERDRFWIKERHYSLTHMLAGDPHVARFVGGTVFQAYLSALSYHRWHSPVAGRVVAAYNVPGTYFAETLSEDHDPAGPSQSQVFISALATGAVILIEADDPALGLVGFVAIGMAEVSTCAIGVAVGQHLAKGAETGAFHYGGSSYCLLTGPDVRLKFDLHGQTPGNTAKPIPVNAAIARRV